MVGVIFFDMNDKCMVDKQKVLDSVLVQIECQFGKGLIMKLGVDNFVVEIEVILIGLLGLDIVLGIGGLFKGCIIEIFGLESLGKIMLMLYVVVEEQKKGGVCVFVDVEYVFDL